MIRWADATMVTLFSLDTTRCKGSRIGDVDASLISGLASMHANNASKAAKPAARTCSRQRCSSTRVRGHCVPERQ